MSTLQLVNLTKAYGNGEHAVRGIDLEIGDGELFVLVGPSGCGKSSVLRMIAGLEDVTAGEVRIDGERVNQVRTSDRKLAMTFQSEALYPHMTVAQNIGFGLWAAHTDRHELADRVQRVAALLHLDDVLDRLPHRLSGGQRQRAALGHAVVRQPRLLLLDEPMSHLDAKLRTETRAAIVRMQRRLRLTTVLVTHDQVEAMAMGDRVAVMCGGVVVQCGSPQDVYDAPRDLFVAQFMGAPAMSIVEATVVDRDGGLALQLGSQLVALDDEAVARRPVLRRLVGRDVALGLRPEALVLHERGSLVVSMASTERVGPDTLVTVVLDARAVTWSDGEVVVGGQHRATLVASTRAVVDDDLWRPLRLDVDTSRIHLFDLATGASLAPGTPTREPGPTLSRGG